MGKDKLRKIKYFYGRFPLSPAEKGKAVNYHGVDTRSDGYFHQWVENKKKQDGSDKVLGLIEDVSGEMKLVHPENIWFMDREADTE